VPLTPQQQRLRDLIDSLERASEEGATLEVSCLKGVWGRAKITRFIALVEKAKARPMT